MQPINYPSHEFVPGRRELSGATVYRCIDCGMPVGVYVRTGATCLWLGYPTMSDVAEVVPGDVVTQYVRQQQEAR